MRRLLIRGGLLADGSGRPSRRMDLIVEGERILDLIPPNSGTPQAKRILDATGQVVCPGFIDIHSHGDLVVALPASEQIRLLAGRIGQGITTQIVGNCGLGVFPCDAETMPLLAPIVGWMTPPQAGSWPDGSWSNLAGYLSHLESNGVWVNVGSLQPHGPLRFAGRMSSDLEDALDAGAFGLSTGLIYPPGISATTEEIADLAAVMARHAGHEGFLASHIRGSSEILIPAVEELLEVGRRGPVRVQHSHSEAVGAQHWHKIDRVLEMEERARRSGIAVAYDMFPYTAAATMMLAIFPPWSLEAGMAGLLSRLRDPRSRAAIRGAIETVTPAWPPWLEGGWPHNLVKAVGWDLITIGSVLSAENRGLEGMSLSELGRARRTSPFDAICDLMLEEGGAVSQIIHGISGEDDHEEGIETLLGHHAGAVCTDADDFGKGRPHPAAFGAFPRVLGRYVRQRRLLTLEQAVWKMTGYPASLLGLTERGMVRPGAWADLVIFDPETVGSEATFDEPRRPATGVSWVIVNGTIVHPEGERAGLAGGRPPGRVLRGG